MRLARTTPPSRGGKRPIATMHTSSNQSLPNTLAAQCKTATIPVIGRTIRGQRCDTPSGWSIELGHGHARPGYCRVMALALDPQVLAELAPLLAAIGDIEPPPIGDVEARRVNGHRMFDYVAAQRMPATGVEVERHTVPTGDGTLLAAGWYHGPEQPGSAVLYLHGGGMIFGLEHIGEMYDVAVREYVAISGVPMLVVDYRVAPEHPHPTPVEDCYAALRWLHAQAGEFGVDVGRIAIGGESAGGGLAAGLALLARDRGEIPLAFQLLIYPMIDDRTDDSRAAGAAVRTWSHDDNHWLGVAARRPRRSGHRSPYAAPARADDLPGLPPTYIAVGDLDSSETRTSPTRGASRMRGSRPSCTCTPAAHMRSKGWPAEPTSLGEQSMSGYVACAPCDHRKNRRCDSQIFPLFHCWPTVYVL